MAHDEIGHAPGLLAMDSLFQLGHWVSLPAPFDRLKFRRALTAMSVGPVDHDWLSTQTGLTAGEASALLQQLQAQDALIVLSPEQRVAAIRAGGSMQVTRALAAFWRWLCHGV